MKDLIYHYSSPKALQLQKRYLRMGMYKSRDTKIRYFICLIDDMAEYLNKFLPEDKILELVEF